MRQLQVSICLVFLALLSSCSNPLGSLATGAGTYQPGTPAGGGSSSSVPITVTGVSLASNNTLSITGSGLDQATNVSVSGIGAFTILSQTATTLTAQASASFQLVLGTLYNLVISSAEASGGTTIDFNVSGANSGSVLFADGSGNATSDNGKFYWDSTTHRLGIGTATPAAALNVIDAANTWPLMVDANTSTNASTWGVSFGAQNSASARTNYADVQATLVSDTAGAESGQLDFHVMNSGVSNDAMTILDSGHVGIGTATPAAALDVNGAIDVNGLNGIFYPASDSTLGASIGIGPGVLAGLSAVSGGYHEIAIGYGALATVTTGTSNIAIGVDALQKGPSTGTGNIAIGNGAGQFMYGSASSNTAIGSGAMYGNSTGASGNTAVGSHAIGNGTIGGNYNTALGSYTGWHLGKTVAGTAEENTLLGNNAGATITTGSYNVVIGTYNISAGITTGNNNILIGEDVRAPSATGSNQLNIGNLIYATGLASGTTSSTGYVGIGTNNPGALLQVGNSGDGTVAEANAWNTLSDRRLKTDIHPIENALEKVLKLQGVSFVWKKDKTGKKNLGFIAQELEKIFPEFVTTGHDGFKSVSYGNITAVLASAIHEFYDKVFARLDRLDQRMTALESSTARAPASVSIQKQLDALKQANGKLSQENAELRARLDRLEQRLDSR